MNGMFPQGEEIIKNRLAPPEADHPFDKDNQLVQSPKREQLETFLTEGLDKGVLRRYCG
jgi:hypothetical protein